MAKEKQQNLENYVLLLKLAAKNIANKDINVCIEKQDEDVVFLLKDLDNTKLDLSKIQAEMYKFTDFDKNFKGLKNVGFNLKEIKDEHSKTQDIKISVNFFKRLDLNNSVCLNLDDLNTKTYTVFSLPVYNIVMNKWVNLDVVNSKIFAHLIAKQNFVVKGQVVKSGQTGGFLEVYDDAWKNSFRTNVKIGENSWVKGSFIGTKEHDSYINKRVKLGNNTLIGENTIIGDKTYIYDNTKIGGTSRIGKKNIIGSNVAASDLITGNKTIIGDGAQIGIKTLNGKTALGEHNFVGISPNYYKHYWWEKGREPINLKYVKPTMKEIIERYILEKVYAQKTTRLGEKVQTDAGVFIESGAIVGNGAKLGYKVKLKANKQIDNNKVIADYSEIK